MSETEANTAASGPAAETEPLFAVNTSRGFVGWLNQHKASLAVTTYQAGKLLFFGCQPDGKLWVYNRNIGRCSASPSAARTSGSPPTRRSTGSLMRLMPDRRVPRATMPSTCRSWPISTGDLDVHDMAVTGDGRLVFVNTLFKLHRHHQRDPQFRSVWRPPFISRLAAEDRCHLNGLALKEGKLAYAPPSRAATPSTAGATTGQTAAW